MKFRSSIALKTCMTAVISTGLMVTAAAAVDIPLTIQNDLSFNRTDYPMSVGVPFAQGELTDVSRLSVSGPSGAVDQWQATALSHWWDGSVRWALVDFPADMPATGLAAYTIREDGAVSSSDLSVSQNGSVVTVSTGVIQFTVDTSSFRVVDSLFLDSNADGSYDQQMIAPGTSEGLVVTAVGGAEYTAYHAAPTVFEIEEQGAQRVTLLFKGELTRPDAGLPLLKYVLRLSAFAGRGDLKAQVTLHNPKKGEVDFGSVGSTYFEDARIELATTVTGASLRAGSDDPSAPVTFQLGSGHFYLHQDSSGDPDRWDSYAAKRQQTYRGWRCFGGLDGSEVQLTGGDRSHGWVEIASPAATASAGIAEFWQNFPNAIDAWGDGRLAARFFSRYQSGDFHLRGGEQKTHVAFFRFEPNGAPDAAYSMPAIMDRIIGTVPAQRYADSGNFKRFLPREKSHGIPTISGDWERMQLATVEGGQGWRGAYNAFRNRVDDDVFGWLDWGDFRAEYESAGDRSNGENDFGYGALLQMVRSGDARWWRLFDPLSRHQADIDVYHAEFEDQYYEFRLGGFFEHDRGGNNRHRGKFPETNHYNAQGMFAYFYLTGDRVVLDAAMEVATNAKYRTDAGADGGYDYGFSFIESDTEMRAPAWLLNIVNEGWKYTRDESWATTALNIIDRTQPTTRCWYDTVPCEYPYNNKPFVDTWQMAMLMVSVGDFLDERMRANGVRDENGVNLLHGWGTWLQANAWMPENNLFGNQWYANTGVIEADWAGGNILRVIDALVHAFNATGDASHLQNLDIAFATATANPWYQDSGVTYGDIKIAATLARNGHAYLDHVGRNVDPNSSGCLPRPYSSPAAGGDYQITNPILLLFTTDVVAATVDASISVSGDLTGSFSTTVSTSDNRAFSVTLSPVPQIGEHLTLTLGPGTSSVDGGVLDGNGDGACGDEYQLDLVVVQGDGSAPDRVPPATVSDLGMVFASHNGEVTVAFTAPADAGPTGRPATIDLRYQVVPRGSTFDWNTASSVSGVGAPGEPGQVQLVPVGVIDAQSGSLQMAVRTVDAAGNNSDLSNVARDPMGPAASFVAGESADKAPGARHLMRVNASDVNRGNAEVTRVRSWVDDANPANAATVDLVPEAFSASQGSALIEVDATSWTEGEQHTVKVQAQDAAGNWSDVPASILVNITGNVPLEGCLALESVNPAPGVLLSRVSVVQVAFTQELDPSSVGSHSFEVIGADNTQRSFAWSWAVPGRVVQLMFKPPLDVRGDVSVTVLPTIQSASGLSFGEGAACDGTNSFSYRVRPELDSGDLAGSQLDDLDDNGRIAVDGFNLTFSGLDPGSTLRVYDSVGRLLHQTKVDSPNLELNTESFGRFPAKVLIVAYRGLRQKVLVGRAQPYLSHLE